MILAIDPSMNNVGWCIHDKTTKLWRMGTIHPKGKGTYERCLNTFEELDRHLIQPVHLLICEFPTFFNSEKGAVAAVKGYTLDLAAMCGYISGRLPAAKVIFKTPMEWKGNLNKKAIQFRFERAFPCFDLPSEHAQEAAMMIKFHLDDC